MSYIRCWTCNGNGLETLPPTWNATRCTDCGGTGANAELTRRCVAEWERSFPSPLPELPYEREARLARQGHNPKGLSEDVVDVRDGWRLLSVDEVRSRARYPELATPTLEIQQHLGGILWRSQIPMAGSDPTFTYRTRRPAGYWVVTGPEEAIHNQYRAEAHAKLSR